MAIAALPYDLSTMHEAERQVQGSTKRRPVPLELIDKRGRQICCSVEDPKILSPSRTAFR